MVSWSWEAPSTSMRPRILSQACPRPVPDRVEAGFRGHLGRQVRLRLVHADERGREPQGDGAVLAGLQARVTGDVRAPAAGQLAARGHRRVEDPVHEEPSGPRRQAAPHVRVAGEGGRRRVQGEAALVGDVVEDDARVVTGIGEPHHRRVVGRRDLRLEAVLEGDAVVVRLRRLVLVPEGQRAGGPGGVGRAGRRRRHDLEGLAVTHPRARLVAGAERLEGGQVVGVVAPRVVVQPVLRAGVGHRGPEVEAVGDRGRGEVVAAREGAAGIGAARGERVVREVARAASRACFGAIERSSIQPWNFAGPLGESYATRIRSTVLPAATVPITEETWFHWLTYSVLAAPWPCGAEQPAVRVERPPGRSDRCRR